MERMFSEVSDLFTILFIVIREPLENDRRSKIDKNEAIRWDTRGKG